MDEHKPLLDNSSVNRHKPLHRLAATNRETPPVERGETSREKVSLFEHGAISNLDTIREERSSLENSQEKTDVEVPLEEVVQALCSAWQQNKKPKIEITLDFFTPRELYAMRLAWENVTRGKHCNAEAHRIAEALAEAMATVINPKSPFPAHHLSFISWNLAFHADKNLLAVNLLREWKNITEGEDNVTTLDDSEELGRINGFCRRQTQLCCTIRSFVLHFRFQILLQSLLLIWPISILILATKYMDCSISHHLLYLLMILGGIGCVALAIRVILILLTRRSHDPEAFLWGWTGLRFIEFRFLIVFIIQTYHFFEINTPSELKPDECVENFYSAVRWTNWVSIALLLAYFLVYFEKICLKFQASD